MHIAATNPNSISADDVPAETLENERRFLSEQAEQEGKPAEIVVKMVEGRLRKYLNEITLLGQPFVKDPDINVGKLLQKNTAAVHGFVRLEVGEGIDKKVENFADEVQAQIKASG
jgi:elongation factor Ts